MSTAVAEKVYGAGLTKARATRSDMELRRNSLLEIAEQAQPASVRHIYYRAVVAGVVPKTHNGYVKVQREILRLRREGVLPYEWISDEARRAHWPQTDRSPRTALEYLAQTYRRDPWQGADTPHVEIWCESESIAGVLMPLKDQFAVPIFPLKGQGSDTFIWQAAQAYWRPKAVVLYAGDYDPAGLQIDSQLEGKLRQHADGQVSIDFRRVSITHEQATSLQVLGTPPKDDHWKDYSGVDHEFVGQAVEAEAVDPRVLREMFAAQIRQVADEASGRDIFAENESVQSIQREQLRELIGGDSE